jgi:hypothetical protein
MLSAQSCLILKRSILVTAVFFSAGCFAFSDIAQSKGIEQSPDAEAPGGSCKELEPGKCRSVFVPSGSLTGLPMNYRICRTDPRSRRETNSDYVLDFNIDVVFTKDYDGKFANDIKGKAPASPERLAARLATRQAIQKCFDEAAQNNDLTDERGRRIALRINKENGVDTYGTELPTVLVAVDSKRLVDHVFMGGLIALSSDLSCDVIPHEFMHVAGLVDEYSEHGGRVVSGTLLKPGTYACRAKGPKNSLMSERDDKILNFTNRELQRTHVLYCKCPQGSCTLTNEEILKQFSKRPFTSCPSGLKQVAEGWPDGNAKSVLVEYAVKGQVLIPTSEDKPVELPHGLYSAQLNSIIYPQCKTKNTLYYECSKNAYRTDNCFDVPPECSQPQKWLTSDTHLAK